MTLSVFAGVAGDALHALERQGENGDAEGDAGESSTPPAPADRSGGEHLRTRSHVCTIGSGVHGSTVSGEPLQIPKAIGPVHARRKGDSQEDQNSVGTAPTTLDTFTPRPGSEPMNPASPKANTPPSEPMSQ